MHLQTISNACFSFQKSDLLMNLEKILFIVGDDVVMHNLKRDLILQINEFEIVMQINGFVVMDGRFFMSVSQIFSNCLLFGRLNDNFHYR